MRAMTVMILLLFTSTSALAFNSATYETLNTHSGIIKCYSGGKLVFSAPSRGAIKRIEDTYVFVNASTQRVMRVSGTCIIEFN